MKQNFKRKLMAGLLSVCMIFQTAGIVPVYAAENVTDSGLPIGTSSVCTHHVHDENCGYTEGTPCNHVHTDECSAEVKNCVHEHTAECYPVQDSGEATGSDAKEPTACTHQCSAESGCIAKELACKHVHDDTCGYKEGTPCTFDTATCESCNPKNTADNIVTLAVEEVYAVYDGSKFCLATAETPTVPTTTEITDKTTINNLYIMGGSVPVELMSGWYTSTNLKTVTCADTVTIIGNNAFKDCTNLASVAVPNVTTIGEYAFFATALTSVSMPEATKIGKSAFSTTALASVSMPKVTKIGGSAFSSCKNLASVQLPNVTTIDVDAFYGCIKLASVQLPNVTTIGGSAFADCSNLTSVNMPKVTKIGSYGAFQNCTKLASLTLGATPPTTVDKGAFNGCPTLRTLTIQGNPAYATEVLAAYKSAAGNDGAADDKWYGWTLPTSLDGTGVSNSVGTLEITTGKSTSNFGQDNAITLTATFDKATNVGKQRALAVNQVEFKDGESLLGTVNSIQNADGKWMATLNVNTKDWAVGTHKLTAKYVGNYELGGITTMEVTFIQGEELNASDGFTFNSTSDEGIYKAGTGTITLVKATEKYQFTFTNAVVASTALNAISLPTDAPVEVKLVGTSTISSTNTGAYSSGIYIGNGSNVILLGDGTLTSAINYTVYVKSANLTMEGGTVINTKEGGTTLFVGGANAQTTINGGTVRSTAKGSRAIQYGYDSSNGTLTVSQPQGKTTLITTANSSSENDLNIPIIDIGNATTAVNISGGTIENTTGNMVISSDSSVTVTGAPSIKGLVRDYRKDADVTYSYLSFYGTAYTLKGSLTTSDVIFMVNAWQTLTIPKGSVLTINTGRTQSSYIQNNGTIQNEGGIAGEVRGNAVQGGGTVAKKAKITFSLTDSNGKPLTNPTYGDTVTVTATPEKDTEALRTMQRAGSTPTFKLMLYKDSGIFKSLGNMTYTKDANGVYTAKMEVKLDSNIKHDYNNSALTAGANYQFACEFSGDELLLKTKGKSEPFTIAQKELTIIGPLPQDRVYEVSNPSVTLTGTATLVGIEAADRSNVMLQDTNITQGELENNYVGIGKKITVPAASLSGSAAQNYSLNTTLIETVDISRADNSISNRSTTSKYYGEKFLIEHSIVITDTTQPTFTCEYKEKAAADNTYTTTLPTNAGEYTMRVSATATQNYNACSATQDFVIQKAPLMVTGGTAEPKKWDGTKTATVTGLTFKNQITSTLLEGDEALAIGKDFTVTKAEYVNAAVNMNIINATVVLQNTIKANNYLLQEGAYRFTGSPIALADGPDAPTFSTMNDTKGADTFTFNSTSATVYQYSKDSGTTWKDITASGATTSITVGNVALVAGALQVRIKATATHNASGVLANTAEQVFTASIDGSVSLDKTAGVAYGDTITATVSGQQSGAVLSYKWLAGTTELQSGTSNTLKVPGSAVGKTITVEVSATGCNGNLISSATNAVAKKAVTATAGTVSKVYDGTTAVETADCTLTITKVNASDDISITAANAVYDDAGVNTGKAITLGDLSISGTAAGWYDVTAPTTVTGEITAKEMTDATVTVGGTYIYTGSAITPTAENVTVKDGTITLTNGTDYGYAASNNTSAGTATLTVTLKGNYSGTASKTFTIAKADPTYSIPTGLTAKYGQTLSTVNIGATTGFSWMDGTTNVGEVGTQTHKARFTPNDINNYNIVNDIDVTFAVEKATPTVTVTAEKKQVSFFSLGNHDDTIILKATVTGVTGGTVPAGTVTFKSETTTIASAVEVINGVAAYEWEKPASSSNYAITAEFAATADTNYGNATGTSTAFDIDKAEQKALNIGGVPNKVNYGDSTFTLSTTGGSGTGDVTYAVTAGDAVSVAESTGVVTVLKAGTATITAAKAGDTNYHATNATTMITVNAAVPTIAWADAAATETLTYTGSAASITKIPTVTLKNSERYDINKIQYAYKKTSLFTGYTDGLPTAAGEYTIKAKIAAEGNYTEADSTNTMALTISRADNSITNGSTTSMYYGEKFNIEHHTVNTDTTQPTFTCEYKERSAVDSTYITTLPTNAGEYTMRVSATATQNYNACSATQDFVIQKAPLMVTGGTAEPKKWDGTKAATVTGLTFKNQITSTLLEGDEALAIGKDFTVTKAEYVNAAVNMNIINVTVVLQNTTKANNYFLQEGAYRFIGSPIALADGPDAPTFSTMNDTKGADTFTFNSTSATVYEYSKNSGATWMDITASGATTSITVGNIALAAGALQVRVKATATHNASGVLENTAEQVFTVSIEGSVSLDKTAGVAYGDTITATFSGQQSGAVLKYQWEADNVAISDATASTLKIPGSAVGKTITVEVTATGYNGSLTSSATNAVAKKAVTATAGTVSKVYDGTTAVETADRTLTITKVNASDDISITAANAVYDDASVNTDKAITLGDLSISGTAADWYDVTAPTTVTGEITAKALTGATVTVGGTYIYTGAAITPTAENVTVKDDATTLTNGTDYDYTASNNTSAGTATVTVTFKGNYSGTASKTFTIAKADPTYSIPTGLTAKYGQTLSAVNIGATTGFSWMDETENVGVAGSQTHKATFTPNDINNYNIMNDIDVTVAVGKATPTVTVTAEKKQVSFFSLGNHDDTIILKATVTGVTGGTVPAGTVTLKSETTTIASAVEVINGVAVYEWAKPASSSNYAITAEFAATADTNYGNAIGTSTAFDIDKVEQKALNISGVPNKVTYGDSTFTLSTTGGSGNGAVTYAVTAGSDVVSVVESTGVVTVLKAGTVTITATKAGDGNYNAKTGTVEITVQSATPTVTWGTAEQSTTYTGSPVLASVLTAPTVMLVKGESFGSTIQYAYKYVGGLNKGLFADYTDGLPTDAGKYDIKAYVAADGNYAAGESTNTMTLTVNKYTPSLTINTMNGKTYDGTAMANPTAGNMTISGTNYADVTFTYSKNSDMSNPLAEAPKDAGTYYVQASVEAGDNISAASSEVVSFTITKASASGVLQEYPVMKELAKDYSFDLSKLLPSISSTQEYGSVTYAIVSTDNADNVLTEVPTSSGIVNGKLTLKVTNVADKDKTATVSISITTDNFSVTNAAITVKTVDKIPLTISNVTMAERVYNGSAYAYTGTPTFTNTTDNKAVTGVSFTKKYEGRAGTTYTKSETAPTNAGCYNLILTVSGTSAETYAGTLNVPFDITQKEVTVKARDKDILMGVEIPSLSYPALNTDYTVAGFIGDDTLTGTVSMSYTGEPDNTKHGSYPINISGGTVSDNYTVKYENGTLTISIDVSLITAAITAANNAKGGIAIYDTAASSVAYGTKFVTTAEMSTLNTAIQTATDAKTTCATLAQIQAVAKALDDAVTDFKAAIKTGTYTAPSGDDDGDDDSSSGGAVTPPPATIISTKPNSPTTCEIKAPAIVDKNGNASITVTDKTVADAIKKAQDEAKKNGTEKNGVSVALNVDTGKQKPDSISANLPKAVQDTLIREKVAEFKVTSQAVSLSFDSKALQEIQKQAGGDVTINVSKADVSKLSKEAQEKIGNRPVFNLYITGKNGEIISDFGGGSVTVSIPYTLQEGENPDNLQAYFIDAKGKLHEVTSTYDPVTKCLVFVTNHFSTYGIGYKENAPKFNDIEKHWAKNDIEFVTARGLLSGTDKATFSPNSDMTRGMFVTALGRLAGIDTNSYTNGKFTDVKKDAYYAPFANWAASNGITNGTTATTFSPDKTVTRQEMAAFMASYAKIMGYTLPKTCTVVTFVDTANVASWASEAVKSMQMAGVIMGKDGNHFDPTGTATRAEVSAVLHRYVELIIDRATAQRLMP